MKMAIERNISEFDMGGGPVPCRFTVKFGGELRPLITYKKSFIPMIEQAQKANRFINHKRTKIYQIYRKHFMDVLIFFAWYICFMYSLQIEIWIMKKSYLYRTMFWELAFAMNYKPSQIEYLGLKFAPTKKLGLKIILR